jgi:hypothetical protein
MPEETTIPYLSFSVCCYRLALLCHVSCLTVSISDSSFAETDRGIEPFPSRNLPAHNIRHRAVRAPMLTRPTKRLTRKSPNCLRKRVGGMSPEVTRMGTSCSFKYVPLIHSHQAHVYAPPSACIRLSHHPHPHLGPPMFHPPTSPHSVQALELHVHFTPLLIPKSFRL